MGEAAKHNAVPRRGKTAVGQILRALRGHDVSPKLVAGGAWLAARHCVQWSNEPNRRWQ